MRKRALSQPAGPAAPRSRFGLARNWPIWLGLAALMLAFAWWQDRRNTVLIENLSTNTFSGELNFPGGRREPVELPAGKQLEWDFTPGEGGHIELRGKMGEAIVRVRGATIAPGQTRIRARFRLTPDGSVQYSLP